MEVRVEGLRKQQTLVRKSDLPRAGNDFSCSIQRFCPNHCIGTVCVDRTCRCLRGFFSTSFNKVLIKHFNVNIKPTRKRAWPKQNRVCVSTRLSLLFKNQYTAGWVFGTHCKRIHGSGYTTAGEVPWCSFKITGEKTVCEVQVATSTITEKQGWWQSRKPEP